MRLMNRPQLGAHGKTVCPENYIFTNKIKLSVLRPREPAIASND